MDIDTVAALVGTIREGEPGSPEYDAALVRLYMLSGPWICIYASSQFLVKPEDEDDMIHAVWLRVMQSLPKLQNPKAFVGWLRQITLNYLREERRKNTHVCQLDLEEWELGLYARAARDMDVDLDLEARTRELNLLLGTLSEGHRRLFVLHVAHGVRLSRIRDCRYTPDYRRVICHRVMARVRAELQKNPEAFPAILSWNA